MSLLLLDSSSERFLMNLRKMVFMGITALLLIAATYIFNQPSVADELKHASIGVEDTATVFQTKSTNELVAYWQARVKDNPKDFISLTYLGQIFASRARETGNVSDYVEAETAYRQALAIDPKYTNAQAYLSTALFAMHDFNGALDQATTVYTNDSSALLALETIGDAQMELGNYAQADAAFHTLLEQVPSPPVFARLARLAWLKGNPDEALNWMQRAVDQAKQTGYEGEEAAWYEFQLGENYFLTGKIDEAEQHYSAALDYFNNYHFALAGLGKVRAAQGRYEEAIAFYQRAVNIIPQPVYLAALGDLYTITGNIDKANQQYDTVDFIGKLAAINQVVYNRELVLFDANHDRKVSEAIALASKELSARKDIYGYDAEAWALAKNQRYQEAANDMDQAMKLGTRDALLYYHAGMIYAALGDHARARTLLTEALSINPYFDLLQARIARATLDQLPTN